MADLTEGELLQALQDALAQGQAGEGADGALTVNDLAVGLGWNASKVRHWLRALKALDRLEMVRVRREALDGTWRSSPAYRLRGGGSS